MDDIEVEIDNNDDMDEDAEMGFGEFGGDDNENVVEEEEVPQNDGIAVAKGRKRAPCWKHFTPITPKGHPKPRAACNWCGTDYACHSKLNGTKSLTHHLKYQCLKFPESKKFTGSRQKILSFKRTKDENGEVSGILVPTVFSADACKRALARMIIIDELPFSFVENEGFRDFLGVLQPKFDPPGRLSVAKICKTLYEEERKLLKQVLKNQRLCLTTDTWTSVQNLNYMCLTGHFIDENWRYQKRILNFCVVSSHKGDALGRVVEECLVEWGITKFLTITVDNASSNNLLIQYLSSKTKYRKNTILGHDFLHVRCSAHILNLIVREGLGEIEGPVGRVRNIVRYVRSSPARMKEFWSCVDKEGIQLKVKPCLDVSTRWNYTYFMLDRALSYQKAFERLCDDPGFKMTARDEEFEFDYEDVDNFEGLAKRIELEKREKRKAKGKAPKGNEKVRPPTTSDWEKIKLYVGYLQKFYLATVKFSGSLYVTCNSFFDEMMGIQQAIKSLCATDDNELHDLASSMSTKFDKYWGEIDKINQLLLYAVVLDPRLKVVFFEFCFRNTLGYDSLAVVDMKEKIVSGMTRLYEWYLKNEASPNEHSEDVGGSSVRESSCEGIGASSTSLKSMFKMHLQKETNMASKSELEKYLLESLEEDGPKFDLLLWWKVNSNKYPILSKVARDVLAIPVSTVASESAFSMGGRVIDPYRSSLSPASVEALICTQQWLKKKPSRINVREQLDELEQMFESVALGSSEVQSVD